MKTETELAFPTIDLWQYNSRLVAWNDGDKREFRVQRETNGWSGSGQY